MNDEKINNIEVIIPPENFKLVPKDYAIQLEWTYNSDKRINSVIVFRRMSLESDFSLVATIPNLEKATYLDRYVGIRNWYEYKIAYKIGDEISDLSSIKSDMPIEPINNNIPLKDEIGGIHYAYWDFGQSNLHKMNHRFTIHDLPTNEDGSLNDDGLYYQFYQGIMNESIGFYYGIQTKLRSPSGEIKKGIIFSRWKTRDIENYALSENAWGESAGYEGDFIGIRESYDWQVGTYEIQIEKDSTDVIGDWYGLKIKKISDNSTEYIGSLRFEHKSQGVGIRNNGITWSELYYKGTQNTPLPSWHVSIDKVFANENIAPRGVYIAYSNQRFKDFSNIYTTNKSDVHFIMGPKVKRTNNEGNLF